MHIILLKFQRTSSALFAGEVKLGFHLATADDISSLPEGASSSELPAVMASTGVVGVSWWIQNDVSSPVATHRTFQTRHHATELTGTASLTALDTRQGPSTASIAIVC